MPTVMRCRQYGFNGWKFGRDGFCHLNRKGNVEGDLKARLKAEKEEAEYNNSHQSRLSTLLSSLISFS